MDRLTIGLERLKNSIKNMSRDKVKNKRLRILRDTINNIIDSQKFHDMSPLEPEEAAQRQQGQGLKIMTPSQLITRIKQNYQFY